MNDKQILVLAEYGWRNGGENSLLAVVPGLKKLGWNFTFACPAETELSQSVADIGAAQIDWNVIGSDGLRKSQDEIRLEIANLVKNVEPAIVHCNSLSTGRLAGPVTTEMEIPSVGYLRDIIKMSRQAISDLNQLDWIVSVSKATKDFHVGHGLLADKVVVIYNGVDLERFAPGKSTGYMHNELGIDRRSSLVLCIGQIGLRKGTDTVIQAFIKLCHGFPDLHLLLIGMRNSKKQEAIEYEQQCHKLCDQSPFANQIHWLGRRTDVDRLFRESRLLLHGARQEPLGRVLLESSASGCPFVATNVGGTAEIVGDCFPELTLCDVDSAERMADAAGKIMGDENCWQSVSGALRRNAETKFHDSRCANDLNAIYERLVGQNS